MADTVTSQTILDTPYRLVMKFTNVSDGTGESAEFRSPQRMVRVGTNLYVVDDRRIRIVDPATGTVSTLSTSGESYDYINHWTSDGTDIYFSSYAEDNLS